jgi:hypothetical protein
MLAIEYIEALLGLILIGTFMAAIGVRTSLRSSTATRAMGGTMGFWLGATLLAYAIAFIVCVFVGALCVLGWLFAASMGLTTYQAGPWFPTSMKIGIDIVFYSQFLICAILIVGETRVRFDRVAGRMTGGKAAVAIDRLIHGIPMAPIRLEVKEKVEQEELDEAVR